MNEYYDLKIHILNINIMLSDGIVKALIFSKIWTHFIKIYSNHKQMYLYINYWLKIVRFKHDWNTAHRPNGSCRQKTYNWITT